jgi:hypothetical protein
MIVPDDLEAFLQRAAQQRKKRRPEIVILEPTSAPPTATPPTPPVKRLAPQPVDVVVAEPVSEVPLGLGVDAHVKQHLDSRAFDERASHLGEAVDRADDDLEARLHQVFDHRVGQLGAPGQVSVSVSEQVANQVTAEIIESFRTPDSLRHIIIMNEILTPAFRRWKK